MVDLVNEKRLVLKLARSQTELIEMQKLSMRINEVYDLARRATLENCNLLIIHREDLQKSTQEIEKLRQQLAQLQEENEGLCSSLQALHKADGL